MTADERPGSAQGPGPDEAPRFTDKRRIDPETYEVRDPLTQAEEAVSAAAAQDDEASKLADERLEALQRAQADLVNLQREYSTYVKRSKAEALVAYDRGTAALAEALIPVLDDIALSRDHGDLVGPFASIAEKLEGTLERFGIERYGEAGEPFDPAVHEALMHSHSAEVETTTVEKVLQPGYRAAERILRPARVAVVDPQE